MKNKDRYFIVSYSHPRGFGSASASVSDGGYINSEQFTESQGLGPIAIINIIELNKKDHDYFNSTKEK